ncbi:FecCD family ABC transporter permease [Paenibacillus sp. BJ-4]|uniref:FecCD family ABC transporter permease n=1 Tax=Paenibacillus sp. BJ-4 TaxID=2878097 RepID=UPI001CF0A613|nr:iron ABC transporter permease [Paenibacillus sp. BJ-4]
MKRVNVKHGVSTGRLNMKRYVTLRSRNGQFHIQLEKKALWMMGGLALALLIMGVISVGWGDTYVHPWEVLRAIWGRSSGEHDFILYRLRFPRAVTGVLVGAALGIAGAVLQGIIRNPLASPDILGITGGASVAAVTFIAYGGAVLSFQWLPVAAVAGALVVSLLVYMLAWKDGVTPIRLVLVGIGLASAMSSVTTLMLVMSSSFTAGKAYIWLTGSVYGASWSNVYTMLISIGVCTPLVLYFTRSLNTQELGDDVATGLGVEVQRHRVLLLLLSVILVGTAVAVAGAIGFVGLIAPHIARRLVGRSIGGLTLVSALVGGLLVYLADLLARTAFYPIDIPAGIFTAGVGAPFFLYLLLQRRNRH